METINYTLEDAQTIFDLVCSDLHTDPCWQEILNLKLPDVSYSCNKIIEQYCKDNDLLFTSNISNVFCDFCDDMYADFCDWMAEEYIDQDELLHYIGRTSSFRLTNLYDKAPYLYRNIFFELMPDIGYIDVTSDGKLYILPGSEGLVQEDINIIVNDLWTNFETYIEPARKTYVYIVDFKRHEINIFKDWIEDTAINYFESASEEYKNFPVESILNCIDNLKNYKKYTCNTKEDRVIYNKVKMVERILRGDDDEI